MAPTAAGLSRHLSSFLAAAFVTSGVLNRDLFFETNGELLFVWERIRHVLPSLREAFQNPKAFHNLEKVGNAFLKYLDSCGPEAVSAFQTRVNTMVAKA